MALCSLAAVALLTMVFMWSNATVRSVLVKLMHQYISNAFVQKAEVRRRSQWKKHKNVVDLMERNARELEEKLKAKRKQDRQARFPIGAAIARDAVSVGITLCGHFKDVGEALKHLLPILESAKYAPVIGAAFAVAVPILQAIVDDKEVSEEIKASLKRISMLTQGLATKVRRLKRSGKVSDAAQEDISKIAHVINNGMKCINNIEKARSRRFLPGGQAQKEALQKWNDNADKLLKDAGLLAAIMGYHEVVTLVDVLTVRHYTMLALIFIILFTCFLMNNKLNKLVKILTAFGNLAKPTKASGIWEATEMLKNWF